MKWNRLYDAEIQSGESTNQNRVCTSESAILPAQRKSMPINRPYVGDGLDIPAHLCKLEIRNFVLRGWVKVYHLAREIIYLTASDPQEKKCISSTIWTVGEEWKQKIKSSNKQMTRGDKDIEWNQRTFCDFHVLLFTGFTLRLELDGRQLSSKTIAFEDNCFRRQLSTMISTENILISSYLIVILWKCRIVS